VLKQNLPDILSICYYSGYDTKVFAALRVDEVNAASLLQHPSGEVPGLHGKGRFLLTLPFDLRRISASDSHGNVFTKQRRHTWDGERTGVAVVAAMVGGVGEISGEGGERD